MISTNTIYPSFFFHTTTPTTLTYTLSLHDALPISEGARGHEREARAVAPRGADHGRDELPQRHVRQLVRPPRPDRKSTRLNSSHSSISYAVFCLKKKIKRK